MMMYPPQLVEPMIEELTAIGFEELNTVEKVEDFFENQKGTSMVVINSVCGCAAGSMRPGVAQSLEMAKNKPDNLYTVFAGYDIDATKRVREHIPIPPSSPSIAIYKDGDLVHFIERHHIEGRTAEVIGEHLAAVFNEVCVD